VRLRLALVYGSLFLVSGAALLAITYALVGRATDRLLIFGGKSQGLVLKHSAKGPPAGPIFPRGTVTPHVQAQVSRLYAQAQAQHSADVHQLLVQSAVALVIMAVLSIGLGWLVAGRVLRPLRTMATTAREISEHNLHERLAIQGPRDEVTNLADTVDELLARLETAFDAQRSFVANASHELRTPLTLERALLEVALADPSATADSLRTACQRVIATGEHHEHLIESLLTLASGERGLERREPFDLSVLTDNVLLNPHPEIDRLGLQVQTVVAPAPTSGDPRLAERLVANLVDNALRHNVPDGHVQIVTGLREGHAGISVRNSGPIVPQEDLERLFEPFQRLGADRAGLRNGHGLGLSIVRAITIAHGATLTARAQPVGGLDIEVRFPVSARPGERSSSGIRANDHRGLPIRRSTVSRHA
jgi:signal transduction histidine kinase